MKKLRIYLIVDIVSETILSVFSAISDEMAIRQFQQSMEANKDKIYDFESIRLFVPSESEDVRSLNPVSFTYLVPESFSDVKDNFADLELFTEENIYD